MTKRRTWGRKTEETEREGVAPKQQENGDPGAETPISRRGHGVALEARAQRCELLRGWVGGDAVCSPHCAAPGDPASATDPGQPALAPRLGRAKLGWAGIDRRSDKSIDFCAEKLIALLAPRTREPPAGGAGDPSVQGGREPGKPRVPSSSQRAGPSPFTPRASSRGKGKEEGFWRRDFWRRVGQTRAQGTRKGSPPRAEFSPPGPQHRLSPNFPRQRQTDRPSSLNSGR